MAGGNDYLSVTNNSQEKYQITAMIQGIINAINKMSQYCKGCAYKVSKTVTEDACPFNSLYWNFLDDKRPFFENNNRMAMMLSLLDKKSKKDLIEIKERAQNIMKHPENY